MSARKINTIFGYRYEARFAALVIVILFLSACTTQAFVATPVDPTEFFQRGITQKQESLIVTAAVPDVEETIELFGADLYSKNIQPVWINKVQN